MKTPASHTRNNPAMPATTTAKLALTLTLTLTLALPPALTTTLAQDDAPAPTVDLPEIATLKQQYIAALEQLRTSSSLLQAFPINQEIDRIREGYNEPKPDASGKLAALRQTYEENHARLLAEAIGPDDSSGDEDDDPAAPPPGEITDWPTSVALGSDFEVQVVAEDDDAGRFVYRTPHFEFECDAQLRTTVVREFGRIFEVTLHTLNQLPLGLGLAPPTEGHFKTRLFVDRDSYIEAGGPPGSAGVFISRGGSGTVLIPLASLGVKKVGSGYSLTSDDAQHTLVHEITHQCMWQWNRKLNTWYVEGIAEYMAAAPYRNGRFKFTRPGRAMRDYLKAYKGVWNEAYTMFGTTPMLDTGPAGWAAGGIRSYASASIMTQFFHHWDGDGDGANMRAYLAAIAAGSPEPQAREQHLLRGRSPEELEHEITRAWRRENLDLTFAAS